MHHVTGRLGLPLDAQELLRTIDEDVQPQNFVGYSMEEGKRLLTSSRPYGNALLCVRREELWAIIMGSGP